MYVMYKSLEPAVWFFILSIRSWHAMRSCWNFFIRSARSTNVVLQLSLPGFKGSTPISSKKFSTYQYLIMTKRSICQLTGPTFAQKGRAGVANCLVETWLNNSSLNPLGSKIFLWLDLCDTLTCWRNIIPFIASTCPIADYLS